MTGNFMILFQDLEYLKCNFRFRVIVKQRIARQKNIFHKGYLFHYFFFYQDYTFFVDEY